MDSMTNRQPRTGHMTSLANPVPDDYDYLVGFIGHVILLSQSFRTWAKVSLIFHSTNTQADDVQTERKEMED